MAAWLFAERPSLFSLLGGAIVIVCVLVIVLERAKRGEIAER
jgi:drug/metabolite transporter (DMT)-like permease